eukprot:scpid55323/ scgid17479/ 
MQYSAVLESHILSSHGSWFMNSAVSAWGGQHVLRDTVLARPYVMDQLLQEVQVADRTAKMSWQTNCDSTARTKCMSCKPICRDEIVHNSLRIRSSQSQS